MITIDSGAGLTSIETGPAITRTATIYTGQGRFGTNPFDDFELFREQSPITYVRTKDTAILMYHGTADGLCPWMGAIEFYNALRFNRKYAILLSYPKEGHGLGKLENRKDLTVRMQQFFEHHLMDKPAPDWMINGVPFLKKKQ